MVHSPELFDILYSCESLLNSEEVDVHRRTVDLNLDVAKCTAATTLSSGFGHVKLYHLANYKLAKELAGCVRASLGGKAWRDKVREGK